ncbi:VOC family protein [Modestobacter versicolor]|uniref:Catechol 2,3-dioxygenase-like lactoylglutathione lyase family enzyme n=1 Tax=Modestobacter versicolor TaxID=429133 RepID=A0A323V5Y5_9ACTN|nr:VOC family protein [Modestobacter versicolor]MBB3676234.1 catechol 2,3-dioxygenase-like lactoylglutathione lyase family enzyme [Modestobacter versicolor]PZA20249.1 VOC family protein [Modestobacter versicolor]
MLNTISITSLYVLDQDEALDFYVGKLGFAVQTDQQFGPMRFLTVALPTDPGHAVLLERPAPPSVSAEIADTVRDLVTKGAGGGNLFFTTDDAHKTHAALKEKGIDLPEEPVVQPYGIDFGFRDPFGNSIRVAQMTPPPTS